MIQACTERKKKIKLSYLSGPAKVDEVLANKYSMNSIIYILFMLLQIIRVWEYQDELQNVILEIAKNKVAYCFTCQRCRPAQL